MTSEVNASPIVGASRPERASGIILILLLVAAFALVIGRIVQVASGPPPPRSGTIAPAFSGPSLEDQGATTRLEDLRGKVVVLDFWATWCPPCVASMPTLDRIHRELGPRGVVVLGLNQEPGQEAMVRAFMREEGLSLPVVMDSGAIAATYGVFSFPTSFVIGKDGVVRAVHRGPPSEATLRAQLESALAEPTP